MNVRNIIRMVMLGRIYSLQYEIIKRKRKLGLLCAVQNKNIIDNPVETGAALVARRRLEGLNDEPLENNPSAAFADALFFHSLPSRPSFMLISSLSLQQPFRPASSLSLSGSTRQMAWPRFCFKARANNRRITGTKRLDDRPFEKKKSCERLE